MIYWCKEKCGEGCFRFLFTPASPWSHRHTHSRWRWLDFLLEVELTLLWFLLFLHQTLVLGSDPQTITELRWPGKTNVAGCVSSSAWSSFPPWRRRVSPFSHCLALIQLSLWSPSPAGLWAEDRSASTPRGSPSGSEAAFRRTPRSSCCCPGRTRAWACCRCSCHLKSGSPCDPMWKREWCSRWAVSSLWASPLSSASSAACWGTRPASAWTSCDPGSCRRRTRRTRPGRTPRGHTPRSARSSRSLRGVARSETRRGGWWFPPGWSGACASDLRALCFLGEALQSRSSWPKVVGSPLPLTSTRRSPSSRTEQPPPGFPLAWHKTAGWRCRCSATSSGPNWTAVYRAGLWRCWLELWPACNGSLLQKQKIENFRRSS